MAARADVSQLDLDTDGRGDSDYLQVLGDRVRQAHTRRGMTRKCLSSGAGISERYVAQLEAGQGNISILLLRQVASALNLPLAALVLEGAEPAVELVHTMEFLRRLPADDLEMARRLLLERFGTVDSDARRDRIALIGLRGAGKSTLGSLVAKQMDVPFIELDRLIEEESGASISAIFELYGQGGFRRFERQCLEQVLKRQSRFVLCVGGSLVSEPATFERLLENCFTIWLKATPEDHLQRVVAQGDTRLANDAEAANEVRAILASRVPFYTKADLTIETSDRSVDECLDQLLANLCAAAT